MLSCNHSLKVFNQSFVKSWLVINDIGESLNNIDTHITCARSYSSNSNHLLIKQLSIDQLLSNTWLTALN